MSGYTTIDLSEVDAVLFDAGGVLVLPDPGVLIPLLAYYGGALEVPRHARAHYAGMAAKSRAGADEGDWSHYDQAYAYSVGVETDLLLEAARVLGRTRSAHLWRWPILDSVSTLQTLAAMQIPLGVVSNASGQIEANLRRSKVCQAGEGPVTSVRVVIDSHVVGVAKPDPGIFEPALEHFPGCARDRILYIGDSVVTDIAAARAAGLRPVLLDPHDDHPDLDCERLASLLDLVGGR
jgi:putative hydrolase of the HAD superfamily